MTHENTAGWADAWIEALESFSHPGRMRRGRRFAARNKIRRLEIEPGEVNAKVKDGKQSYKVHIQVTPLDDASWDMIIDKLARQAIYSAKLLSGEIPPEVIEVFGEAGASLFPTDEALQSSCTCQDWEIPCKHIAGVYYQLAENFEDDPFLLFSLRGRGKEDFLTALRQQRQTTDQGVSSDEETFQSPPLAETLDAFWDSGPGIDDICFHIARPSTSLPHLKRLGPPPFTKLDLVAILSPIYDTVTETALDWAYHESGKSS